MIKKFLCLLLSCMLLMAVAKGESVTLLDGETASGIVSMAASQDKLYALSGETVFVLDPAAGEASPWAVLQGAGWLLLGGEALWALNLANGEAGPVTADGFEKQVDLDWSIIDGIGTEQPDSLWSPLHQDGKIYLLRRSGSATAMGGEELLAFDEKTGKAATAPLPYALELTGNSQGLVVLWQDISRIAQGETGLVLQAADEEGRLGQVLASNLSYQTGGAAYDAKSDRLFLSGEGELKRALPDGSLETAGYLEVTSGLTMPAAIAGDWYAVAADSGVKACPLAAELAQVERLTILGGAMDENAQAFMAAHPELKLSFVPSILTTGETIRNDVTSGSAQTDIYVISSLLGLWTLIDKGYVAPLEDAELVRDVESMYPQMTQALMKDGKLYAYPQLLQLGAWSLNQAAWDTVGWEEPVPQTFLELMDLLKIWNEDYQEAFSEYNFMQLYMGKAQLVSSVLEQYALMYAKADMPLKFDDERFIAALERIRQLDIGGLSVSDASELTPDVIAQITQVMMRETLIEQIMSTPLLAGSKDRRPIVPMVFEKGEQPAIRAQLMVYVINANSPRKEQATAFIRYMAGHQSDELRVSLHPDDNTPVRPKDYDKRVADLSGDAQLLTAQLETAKPEEKKALEEQLQNIQELLAQMDENEWLISAQGIADYRALAPYMTMGQNAQFLYNNENQAATEELNNLLIRFIDGQMDSQQLVRELDKKLDMMFKERR